MSKLAGDKDLSADIAAVTVGNRLWSSGTGKQEITNAVRDCDKADGGFTEHVRNFVKSELSGKFNEVDENILRLTTISIVRQIIVSKILDFLNKDKDRNDSEAEINRNKPNFPKNREQLEKNAIELVSDAFIEYLRKKGNFYL